MCGDIGGLEGKQQIREAKTSVGRWGSQEGSFCECNCITSGDRNGRLCSIEGQFVGISISCA